MHVMGVNLYAVLVCALVDMVAGFVWYSPALFAKPWTILMGYQQLYLSNFQLVLSILLSRLCSLI